MRVLRAQLKRLKESRNLLTADDFWVSENKQKLMKDIACVSESKEESVDFHLIPTSWLHAAHIFVPRGLIRALRPAFSALLVLFVVFAGWSASVSASFYSLPGDILWNFKIAGEKAQMAMATIGVPEEFKKGDKVKRNFEFAERRVEEIKRVTESKDEDSAHRINIAKKQMQKSIDTAVEVIDEEVKKVVKQDPKKAIELAKGAQDGTASIVENLKHATEDASDSKVMKEVSEAVRAASEKGFTPVETVVENINIIDDVEGEVKLDQNVKEDIKDLVSTRLDRVLKDSNKVKDGIESVKDSYATAQETTGQNLSDASTTTAGVEALETNIASSSSLPSAQTGKTPAGSSYPVELDSAVLNDAKEKTRFVEESAQEIKELIEGGKLAEAIGKIKGIDIIAKDAGQILNEARASDGSAGSDDVDEKVVVEQPASSQKGAGSGVKDMATSSSTAVEAQKGDTALNEKGSDIVTGEVDKTKENSNKK